MKYYTPWVEVLKRGPRSKIAEELGERPFSEFYWSQVETLPYRRIKISEVFSCSNSDIWERKPKNVYKEILSIREVQGCTK